MAITQLDVRTGFEESKKLSRRRKRVLSLREDLDVALFGRLISEFDHEVFANLIKRADLSPQLMAQLAYRCLSSSVMLTSDMINSNTVESNYFQAILRRGYELFDPSSFALFITEFINISNSSRYSHDRRVRASILTESLARNDMLTPSLSAFLCEQPLTVRALVTLAENEQTPVSALINLIGYNDKRVVQTAAANPSTPLWAYLTVNVGVLGNEVLSRHLSNLTPMRRARALSAAQHYSGYSVAEFLLKFNPVKVSQSAPELIKETIASRFERSFLSSVPFLRQAFSSPLQRFLDEAANRFDTARRNLERATANNPDAFNITAANAAAAATIENQVSALEGRVWEKSSPEVEKLKRSLARSVREYEKLAETLASNFSNSTKAIDDGVSRLKAIKQLTA